MCSRIAARRESRACETDSSVAACSAAASALLCCSSQLRTFGSASKVISSWICFGVASWLVVAGFPDLAVAAHAADTGAAATLTLPVSILIFAVRSEKCYANAHGLSSDRLPAQDRLPDARRPAEARAADSGALGRDGSLPPAARGRARTRKICPARWTALRQ